MRIAAIRAVIQFKAEEEFWRDENGLEGELDAGFPLVAASLGGIHEFAGHIARVGGFQCRVGETLARAVSRDKILEDGQPLAEVRQNRLLDDGTVRLGHQAAQAGELADLRLVAPGAGGLGR